jgi:metallo-beta-lactamase class B
MVVMTFKHFILSCLCFTLFSSFASQTYGQADEESRTMNQPVKPYRVIGNIYYVGAADVSSFLITTPAGHILLDSGFFETVPQIQQNLTQLGFKLADVKIIINSHAHYDHAGGIALLKELTGARFMASAGDVEQLARGGKGDPQFGDRFSYQPVKTDRILSDGDKVELGDVTLIAHLTPGHTKGCTTWTMKVKEGQKQYDVVFVGSSSFPGYKLVNNEAYPTIVTDYERTFRVLKQLPCDVFLAAHGSFYAMQYKAKHLSQNSGRNPFIDPARYRTYVTNSEKAFRKELLRQQGAEVKSPTLGRSLNP